MTVLGFVPKHGTLILSRDADWVCVLRKKKPTVDPWPEGTEVWVEFPALDVRWDAVVTASAGLAAFRAEQDQTGPDVVPQGADFRIMMRQPGTPSTEFLWFRGEVQRHD